MREELTARKAELAKELALLQLSYTASALVMGSDKVPSALGGLLGLSSGPKKHLSRKVFIPVKVKRKKKSFII